MRTSRPGSTKRPASGEVLQPVRVIDEASRALVIRLHNNAPPALRSTDKELHALVTRLEQTIIADTALNQLRLRPQISREMPGEAVSWISRR
jgi:hypothetical protein